MVVLPNGFTYLGISIFWGKRIVDWFKPSLDKNNRKIKRWTNIYFSYWRISMYSVNFKCNGKYIMSYYNVPKKLL